MEENVEQPQAKTLEDKKSELDRKKYEEDRKLVAKANQVRAFCYAHNPEFFEIGKEECELLEKYFPQEAKALKEKLAREQKKDARQPGSVNYSDLLMEIEGLANKAFKTMLENMKSQKKSEQAKKEEPKFSEYQIDEMQREFEQSKQDRDDAKKESIEAEKNRPAQTKTNGGGAKGDLIQDLEDSYYEGYTGKKIVRKEKEKDKKVENPVSKKEQKKLDKAQKKMEKQQKKLAKAQKKNKVSSVSLDEINKAKDELNGKGTQMQVDAKKLKAYEDNLKERSSSKAASSQDNSQSQEQAMGMAREYNPPTSSSSSTKPKK